MPTKTKPTGKSLSHRVTISAQQEGEQHKETLVVESSDMVLLGSLVTAERVFRQTRP